MGVRNDMRGLAAALILVLAGCSPEPSPPASTAPGLDVTWRSVGPALGDCRVQAAVVRPSGELVAVCRDGSTGRTQVLTTRNGIDWEVPESSGIVSRGADHVTLVNALVEEPGGVLDLLGAEALSDLSAGDATVWTSTDAVSWTRGPRSRSIQDGEMFDAVATQEGLIAVGANGFPGASVQLPGLHGPVAWHSGDSPRWQRIPMAQGREPQVVQGIIATASGFVAWGSAAPPGTGAVWTSPDGSDWAPVAKPFGESGASIGTVVEAPGGGLVAVGCRWPEEGDPLPGAWSSADGGQTWLPAAFDAGSAPGCLWDALWAGDRFVATGSQGRLLTSVDGADWAGGPVDATMRDVTIDQLVPLGDSIVGFGSTESEDDGSTAGIWRRDLPR